MMYHGVLRFYETSGDVVYSRKCSELLVLLAWVHHAGTGEAGRAQHHPHQRDPLPSVLVHLRNANVSVSFVNHTHTHGKKAVTGY